MDEGTSSRPFLIIAHRGAPNHAPENTIAAFDKALELGFTHVELDAQLTADGVAVVFHDATLERTTGGSGPLAERTLEELKELDAGGWFSDAFSGERIPTLEEVLVRYRGRAYLHLELKSEEPGLPTIAVELLAQRGWPTGEVPHQGEGRPRAGLAISSFHRAQLERMRRLLPRMPLAWLVPEVTPEVLDGCQRDGFQVVCPRAGTVVRETVEEAGRRGLRVRAWGLRAIEELDVLVYCGVEGTTCDWPDVAREHLRRLGVSTYP